MMKNNKTHTDVNLVTEPEVFYLIDNPFDRIVGVLGGVGQVGQVVNSDIDLITITRKGLPKSVAYSVCEVLDISMDRLSDLLHISHRTLQRKADDDLLTVSSTEQLFEIAEVVSNGIDVFGTLENFRKWIHSTPYIFNGQAPLDFLDTRFGIQYVNNIIGRIAHGIPS
ncbi:putative toxin-antitoxin system antitoxin component, TIGR02293 family [Aequorivita sublithincola DSM 14238]|uniref:Putative toxin-antitoxin system antitoxin component, TIGR02293 family n=1 Tax=Aequorivita sublithincola (strain DSM 14238 / LMG 21431 / ACAM 643 / 9-3) TaxID=746697 RepID=I3YSD8_AEQSU|nr:antitoxin Xre/MbcA/ParS toxin-binding domain-containing protein [Aequorivita sublithincola]AFL79906.1 putative toxin-antitoxin system antitoxin component, TIGR02293 family [Aequorivita sublithincola DSM 14238]